MAARQTGLVAKVLLTLLALLAWALLAGYLALQGAFLTRVVPQGDSDAFFQWAQTELSTTNPGNSALILIENQAQKAAYYSSTREQIDKETLFPTASFSKWLTALAVMKLAATDAVDLDAPVSTYLTRWQLPDSQFDHNGVTPRRLLSHTAGLGDGLGFGDYLPDEPLPTLDESLRRPRASSGKALTISVTEPPGESFTYSGGGYLILQLLVEEVSGMSFEAYVQAHLFAPLGMTRSTYRPLGNKNNASPNYDADGQQAPFYAYASAAATGLASSAEDLLQLSLAVLSGDSAAPFDQTTLAHMRQPLGHVMGAGIWGMGTMLYAPTASGDFVFGHDGGNDPAINSTVRLNPDTGDGIIVLVSGHPALATQVGSEWVLWQTGTPDFLQTDRALESALLPLLIGGLIILGNVLVFGWRRRRAQSKTAD